MYVSTPFDLIVEMPLMLSLSIEKIGDLARPSNLFNSLDVLTNVLRTRAKYQINGGMSTRIKGKAINAAVKAPVT
jgi:hypothetical protein